MKNLWFKRLLGSVTVKLIGISGERIINELIRQRLVIWNVKRMSKNEIIFQMFIKDIRSLRQAIRTHRVKVRFIKRAGFPSWLKRFRRNIGIFIGVFIALIIIIILSNMIWKVEIEGASPDLEYKMVKQLKEMGVKIGGFQFLVDDPEGIQRKLTAMNEEVTWIGVELNGTSYHFQVVEKEQPDEVKKTSPRHLVAKKEAIIVDYFVEKGEPVITINDFVKPGQLLVSGLIGREDAKQKVSAKGEILGKTWYTTEVEVDLTTEFELLTGKENKRTTIDFGNISIPIWGFSSAKYKHKQVEENKHELQFLKWKLPISITNKTIKEVEVHEKTYSTKEAKKLAQEIARKDLQKSFSEEAKIIDEKILHEKVENGKLKLLISYDVIENIAKEAPIIEEERED
ncbi:sporulation protein YqfD [Pallidibacillus pasinlerensis]|uniref:Sporulation protein YqfD n=1 Tax=Pallidibacillus pasinlerensis TaxID=2703818 RepID=A0ABX0ABB6_9BACI|nr:sporulation protein YqfD [Pallidibacillus pasinlerensis]NCU18473.1 sporulation protein YqfD [Pallidibacillus pasinlerensis]